MSRAVWGALYIPSAFVVPQIARFQPRAISACDREMLKGWSNGRYLALTGGKAEAEPARPSPSSHLLWGSESQNHWVREDLKAQPVPPRCRELGATHQLRLLRASSKPASGTSSNGAPTTHCAAEPGPQLPLSKEFQTAHNSQHSCHQDCPTSSSCLSVLCHAQGSLYQHPPVGLPVLMSCSQ